MSRQKKEERPHLIRAEQKKLSGRLIWTVPVGFLLLTGIWNYVVVMNFDAADKAMGYCFVLYDLSMMNCIFMPVMIAVIASRLCDMEIKGNTLKLLYTLERPGRFYDIKFLFAMKYLLIFTVGETLAVLLTGLAAGFTEVIQPISLIQHFLAVTAVGAVIMGVQQILSLMCENQILPLLAGIAGAFLGLFSLFFPESVSRFVLWGYFGIFAVAEPDWAKMGDSGAVLRYTDFPWTGFLMFAAAGIFIYLIERRIFLGKEL